MPDISICEEGTPNSCISQRLATHRLMWYLCEKIIHKTALKSYTGEMIELGGTWAEKSYAECILEATQDEHWFERSKEEKLRACEALEIEVNPELEDF